MNDTVIYNGTFLENGLNLNDIVVGGNSYNFYVEAYTGWNLVSRSIESPFIFFDTTTSTTTTTITTTTTTITATTNFLGNDMWEDWVWYIIIVGSSILGILLIVLLFCCCRTTPPSTQPTRPSIYNPAYESVNIKRNNIRVDEIERGAIKNEVYQPMEFEEEEDEKVLGFGHSEETESVEYLHILDNNIPPPPPVPTYSKPRRRRR